MKKIKLFCCLIFTLVYLSCENNIVEEHYPYYQHTLLLSFKDVSGNDLVKGIGYSWNPPNVTSEEESIGGIVYPHLYTLKVIFPEGATDVNDKSLWPGTPEPSDTIKRPFIELLKPYDENMKFLDAVGKPLDGYEMYKDFWEAMGDFYHLMIISHSRQLDDVEKLVFRLTCPYVFGDYNAHDIVTYWRESYGKNMTKGKACYRIEFEDKEITEISYAQYEQLSFATIVIDK